MVGYVKSALLAITACALVGVTAYAAERNPTIPRVPDDQLAAAKAMKNPIANTPENIAQGKSIYERKGTCFTCHGASGKGDGPAGLVLDPSPRNFTNPEFQKNRTDGELFWVIKNGSPETGMVPMTGKVITEDDTWHVILYLRTFAGR
jgi:mono/diheme cytochrome c family protein